VYLVAGDYGGLRDRDDGGHGERAPGLGPVSTQSGLEERRGEPEDFLVCPKEHPM